MRVVSNSASKLVLEHKPFVIPIIIAIMVIAVVVDTLWSAKSLTIGQWIGAGAGVLVGALMTYITSLSSRTVFDAECGEVCWQHNRWPGGGSGCCSWENVTDVKEIQDTSSDGGGTRVALYTGEGLVPLTRHFSGTDPNKKNVDAIKKWLREYQASWSTKTATHSAL